jgi:catechol 2,3-dioxygenase-like lactoylglutathione lyase family enzyme
VAKFPEWQKENVATIGCRIILDSFLPPAYRSCAMLHHLSFAVADLARSAKFYDAVLSPLGYVRVWSDDTAIGYGLLGGGDKFAIKLRKDVSVPGAGFHAAFAAPTREAVMIFYQKALVHGGQDNGGAGLHPEYGPGYFAAFVSDPDGYRIEAVINENQ